MVPRAETRPEELAEAEEPAELEELAEPVVRPRAEQAEPGVSVRSSQVTPAAADRRQGELVALEAAVALAEMPAAAARFLFAAEMEF
jgi:hypothetical protein